MSNEEQHKRVMAWAQDALNAKALYMESLTLDDTERKEIAAVLLAQEAELADQRVLLERWSEAWSSKDRRYPYPETRAHLDGSKKAGWSEVLGILNDSSTPRETLEEVTQKFIDDETERRAEADELEPLHPSLADSAAPPTQAEVKAMMDREKANAELAELRQQIAEFAQERGNFARTIFELRGIIERGEAANKGQAYEIGNLRDHGYNQAGRITELEEQIGAYRNYGVDQAEEVTRLREALEVVRKWLTQKGLSPDEYDMVMDFISNALAGEKGAESEDNTATTTIGNSLVDTGGNSNRTDGNTEESGGSEVGKDADASIQQAQTPLSESLELGRRQCNASNSTVGGDPAGRLDLANAIFLNDMAHQIEQRDADVVAAIAALTAGQYRIEEEDRQQRDLWSKQQEKIDALTEAVLLLGTEVAIPKRKRETTIALGKLRKNGGE